MLYVYIYIYIYVCRYITFPLYYNLQTHWTVNKLPPLDLAII
jgi:hypothetical protein